MTCLMSCGIRSLFGITMSFPFISCGKLTSLLDRDLSMSPEALAKAGQEYFESTYGDTSANVHGLLEGAFPDLGMTPLLR